MMPVTDAALPDPRSLTVGPSVDATMRVGGCLLNFAASSAVHMHVEVTVLM
jgi:hypothetical protein